MGRQRSDHSEARQRLLETADRLFYQHGIRAIGIDRVIAEAGVAKMTLYTHFASKDDLVLAVLHHREAAFLASFQPILERHQHSGGGPVRGLFAAFKEWFAREDFRGCAFINAAVELADPAHPGRSYVREQKRRFGEFIRGYLTASLGAEAASVVPAIALLIEGAIVTALIHGAPEVADVAADAAEKILESARRG